jgi:PAS domain-containing protein
MKENHKSKRRVSTKAGSDFFGRLWKESWTYIKTVVDVVREPVLILDKDFRVIAANDSFYKTFHVKQKDTEHKIVYELRPVEYSYFAKTYRKDFARTYFFQRL